MSKKKSQIGSSAIARQQPPPIMPGQRWVIAPPIAGASVVIRKLTPVPEPSATPEVSRSAPRLKPQQHHVTTTKSERRALRDQIRSRDLWVTATDVSAEMPAQRHAARKDVPVQTPPQEQAPAKTTVSNVSPELFKRLIAQLQVRIDELSALQKKRGMVLADPAVHRDVQRWQRLRSEFEAAQAKLDELVDRREFADNQLDSLREPLKCGVPFTKRIVQRLPTATLRTRLGQRVRDLRTRRGLSQEALARLAELPSYTLPSIETGDKSAPVDALAAIAYALDLTLSELLLGIDAPTPEAERLGGVLAAHPEESQRALALVEVALAVAAK